MKYKLSPWHDGKVRPVHHGVYKVYCKCCNSEYYSRWNGSYFGVCESKLWQMLYITSLEKDSWLDLVKWQGILKE